ncbi:MAG: cytochrome-c peroxidase [Methylococcales bacterium]
MKTIIGILALTASAGLATAGQWEALPDTAPVPADNPSALAKIKLGQILFLDPRLSSTGTVSCNSCHNVMLGGEDNRPVAMGVNGQIGGRSAPTVWNAAFNSVQFWDGRAASLEAQAAGPVTNPIEMGMKSWDDVVKRLNAIPGYAGLFEQAFGSGSSISREDAVKAIAAYERTLITPDSAYDKTVKGDKNALTEQQIRGMEKFAEVGCANCHSGPAFNGPEMPAGTGVFMKFPVYENKVFQSQYQLTKDKGRFEVTGKEEDKNTWKVPTLRNVALTAPYFHNGSVKTLNRAVELMGVLQLDKKLSESEIEDIVTFLNALSGPFPKQRLPELPGTPGSTFN